MAEHPRDHHGHGGPSVAGDRRALTLALVLLIGFMVFEVAAAVASNSVALLADAGHMLVDVGAIACSLVAIRLAARPETGSHTYGLKRAEILAAAANGIALLVISSELPELIGLSDRILVMAAGRIVGEVPRAEATEQRVLNLAMRENLSQEAA